MNRNILSDNLTLLFSTDWFRSVAADHHALQRFPASEIVGLCEGARFAISALMRSEASYWNCSFSDSRVANTWHLFVSSQTSLRGVPTIVSQLTNFVSIEQEEFDALWAIGMGLPELVRFDNAFATLHRLVEVRSEAEAAIRTGSSFDAGLERWIESPPEFVQSFYGSHFVGFDAAGAIHELSVRLPTDLRSLLWEAVAEQASSCHLKHFEGHEVEDLCRKASLFRQP